MDEQEVEFLREKLNIEEVKEDEPAEGEKIHIEGEEEEAASEAADEVQSLHEKASHKSGASVKSFRSSATYVSHLEKQLDDERKARERLEKELQEIKKIASEANSAAPPKASE